MNSGEVVARAVPSGAAVRLAWRDGAVTAIELLSSPAADPGLWIAPTLTDLQVNGFAGIDFQRDGLAESDLVQATSALAAAGCGRFLITLITDEWEAMMRRLRHLRRLRARAPLLQAAIAGWHLEGPFLSSRPGFCGAHPAERMIDPTPGHLREVRAVAETDPVLLTLAPERSGALVAIEAAVSLGMKVSLGHTDASAEMLAAACQAGATGFTHFGNACPQALDRHDNILWRVLDREELAVSLIPDGFHVAPALFRLVHRLRPEGGIYHTTDAVSAAGAAPGRYTVGPHEVDVGPDQVVRQPGRSNYAGSGLRPIEGVLRSAAMLGRPWQSVWEYLSAEPAKWMGFPDRLAAGQPADFCLLRDRGDEGPICLQTRVRGALADHTSEWTSIPTRQTSSAKLAPPERV